MEKSLLTTPEVAERLGLSIRRVQALIKAGRLPSQQFGRDHVINEADLALVAERKVGRPKKEAAPVSSIANGSTSAKTVTSSKPTKNAIRKGSKR